MFFFLQAAYSQMEAWGGPICKVQEAALGITELQIEQLGENCRKESSRDGLAPCR